jgi:hypothetical protein
MGKVATKDKPSPRIAVIGFGSLIWRNRSRHGKLRLSSGWHTDGPLLPVEYSRVSGNGRLTLVILPDAEPQRALWAYSSCSSLDDARENLRKREGKVKSRYIGIWERDATPGDDPTTRTVSRWAEGSNLESAVWTELPPRDRFGVERQMPAEEALDYLASLKDWKRRTAREYIIKTPGQIDTEVRRLARDKLAWTDYVLPNDLFET